MVIKYILHGYEGFGSKGNPNLESMRKPIQSEGFFGGFRGFLGLNSKIYIKRTVEITAKEKIRELQRHEAER